MSCVNQQIKYAIRVRATQEFVARGSAGNHTEPVIELHHLYATFDAAKEHVEWMDEWLLYPRRGPKVRLDATVALTGKSFLICKDVEIVEIMQRLHCP